MAEGSEQTLIKTLTDYGKLGVMALRTDVEKVSATGKTTNSIRFEISIEANGSITLTFLGRAFFKAIETGRGPRENSQYQQFDMNLYEYMQVRGLFKPNSTEKQKQAQSKSLAWYINKHGDKTYREGGRIVYSETLTKLVSDLRRALISNFQKFYLRELISATKIKGNVS